MKKITCVGILCADVLAKPVEKLPERGKLERIDTLNLQIGGCAANAAVDLAIIGVETSVVGKIGQDGFGDYLRRTLQNAGVDVSGLKTDPTVPTSASVVTIDPGGERSILHCTGANGVFSYEDIDLNRIRDSEILFIAGTFLMPAFDGAGTEKLLKAAREAGVRCFLDTAWDFTGQWMNKLRGALPYLDWFMPSYDEACRLSGSADPQNMAETFLAAGVRNVVIKLGKDGCYVKPGKEPGFFVPTYSDIRAVDTSGAGDAFCAGFMAAVLEGWDIAQCAKFANAVGTLCVTQIGTTAGIRSRKETLEFMNRYESVAK